MLNLDQCSCLGAALRDALERWPNEVCLIESDRNREKTRLTYSDFKETAHAPGTGIAGCRFRPRRPCCHHHDQSVQVADFRVRHFSHWWRAGPARLQAHGAEHLQLLAHSHAKFLVVEYHLWRPITRAPEFSSIKLKTVLVTEAPLGADLAGAFRWEDFRRKGEPEFVRRQRDDAACIVYSSGTGGRPKGCVLTHENYLEQCGR